MRVFVDDVPFERVRSIDFDDIERPPFGVVFLFDDQVRVRFRAVALTQLAGHYNFISDRRCPLTIDGVMY